MDSQYIKKKNFIVNTVYIFIIGLIVYITIRYALSLVSPFIFAFIIAYLLQKPSKYINRKFNIPLKNASLILVFVFYLTIIILLSISGASLISFLTNVISNIPMIYKTQIEPVLNTMFDGVKDTVFGLDIKILDALNKSFDQIVSTLGNNISNMSLFLVTYISTFASTLPSFLIRTLLMVISTFFIASDFELITKFISKQFSDKANSVIKIIRNYIINTLFVVIKSYLIIMSITFVELSIGLTIIGVSNSILIAFIIAVFDILPIFGTGGIMIPWAIISLVQGNYQLGISLFAIYIIITIIRNIIEPRIVGQQLGLHPIVTLMCMFIGTSLFGVIGLFGLPIVASLVKYLNDNGTIRLFK